MQLYCGAKDSGSDPQCIALGSCPCSPLDYHRLTKGEEFLSKCPLKRLDSLALLTVVEIDFESIHPFVWTEADGAKLALELFCVTALA
jgi:hypothetical protein